MPPTFGSPRRIVSALLLSVTVAGSADVRAQDLQVRVLSTRPDMVSAGNALVEISGIREGDESSLAVTVAGRTVTDAFRTAGAGSLRGLVEGLAVGRNTLDVRAGSRRSRLDIVNHPITGPVFSGPHQAPFNCQTVDAGLGPALDANCSASTVVAYFYRSTDPPPPPPARGAAPATARGTPPPAGPQRGAGRSPPTCPP